MYFIFETLFLIIAAIPIFFLVMPSLSLLIARIKGLKKSQALNEGSIHYALVITCYKDATIAIPLIDSLLKQSYKNWSIYLVADDCDASVINFIDDRLHILSPAYKLGSKVKSILFAIENYKENHPYTIVFDPDNLAHPQYLGHINYYHSLGYQVVQGQRTAKNLDTVYACLDAMGETYYNCVTRAVPFALGSSATIAGSGMSVHTEKYKAIMEAALTQSKNKVIVAEDKILQSELVKAGLQIAYNSFALVYDEKVATGGQVQRQRARWINSYFKYFAYNKTLFREGIKSLNFNQLFFTYIIIYPPMFLLVGISGLLMLGALAINWYISLALFLSLLIFATNFLNVLSLSKAPRRIWLSIWGLPLFIWKQFSAFLNIKQSNKDFLTTEHDRFYTIDEVLEAEKTAWNISPQPLIAPKKILHIIRQGSFGGGETYLYSLVQQLDEQYYNNQVLSFTDGAMIQRLEEDGIKNHIIAHSGFFSIGLIFKIFKLIRKENIEIVHAHGTKAAFNSFLPSKIAGVPLIYTVHGWSFHSGQSSIVNYLRIKLESFLVRKTTVTVLVSKSNLNEALSHNFKGNFEVIQNGINTKRFNPEIVDAASRADFGLSEDDLIIASIARLTFQKGPEILIKAFKEISTQVPNAKLLFVGGGELLSHCQRLVKSAQLEDKVVFSDFTGNVSVIYKMVDLFVLPSYWEGFSLSLLEALAMKKIAIVSDYPSNVEVVKHKETGYVFKTGEVQSLAETILEAINTAYLHQEITDRASKLVREHYSFPRVVNDNIRLYEKIGRKQYHLEDLNPGLRSLYKQVLIQA